VETEVDTVETEVDMEEMEVDMEETEVDMEDMEEAMEDMVEVMVDMAQEGMEEATVDITTTSSTTTSIFIMMSEDNRNRFGPKTRFARAESDSEGLITIRCCIKGEENKTKSGIKAIEVGRSSLLSLNEAFKKENNIKRAQKAQAKVLTVSSLAISPLGAFISQKSKANSRSLLSSLTT
jgi:hypothetical protein